MIEAALVGSVGLYNLLSNRVLPDSAYVPANLTMAAASIWLARRAGVSREEMGLGRGRLRSGLRVGLGAAGGVASVLAAGAARRSTRRHFSDERVRGASPAETAYQGLVRIPLGTAVFEEAVFRGALFGLFLRRMSPLGAAAASSFLFGLWHVLPAIDRWRINHRAERATSLEALRAAAGAVAATSIAGFGFSWLRLRARSLLAPILAHASTNGLGYLAAHGLMRTGRA